MRRVIPVVLGALILASGLLAAPATRPAAKAPASQPTTAPARADPAFVADFNEHLINAKFDDVIAKLRAMGATDQEPKRFDNGQGPGRSYRLDLAYPWEWATYTFYVDGAGLISKYEFRPTHWPEPPGSDVSRHPENKLQPGNKWWLVKSRIYLSAEQSMIDLQLAQARSPNEAAQKQITKRKDQAIKSSKAMKMEVPGWLAKSDEVEVHEWFTPRLTSQHQDR